MRPETPQERRARELLQQDVEDSPLRGRRIEQRLRNFRPNADSYLAALGGPLPYMRRLKAIHAETEEHELQLAEAYAELAAETAEFGCLSRRWGVPMSFHTPWYNSPMTTDGRKSLPRSVDANH